jgi:hypothetical protein
LSAIKNTTHNENLAFTFFEPTGQKAKGKGAKGHNPYNHLALCPDGTKKTKQKGLKRGGTLALYKGETRND